MNIRLQQFVWWIGIGGIVVVIIAGGFFLRSDGMWFSRTETILGGPVPFPGDVTAQTVADVRDNTIHIVQIGGTEATESVTATYSADTVLSVAWADDALLWIEESVVGAVGEQGASIKTYQIMEALIPGAPGAKGEVLYQSSKPISNIATASNGKLLSFVENNQLYVLNRDTRVTRRVSEQYKTAAWSRAENALLVADGESIVYIALDANGAVRNTVPIQGNANALSFAFVQQYVVAASRASNGVQLELIDLRTSSVVQTITVPFHTERSSGLVNTRRIAEVAQRAATSGGSALSVFVSPDGEANTPYAVSVFDAGSVASTIQIIPIQNESGAIDWRMSTEAEKELRIDEKPILWQDSATLWVLRGSTLSELSVGAGGQTTLSTSMIAPVPFRR